MVKQFKFSCYPEVRYGVNAVSSLHEVIKNLGGTRVLLVVDGNFALTDKFTTIKSLLNEQNIGFEVFDKLEGEPSTETGDACAVMGKHKGCDIVCGIGGGSALDTAKAAAVLISNGGKTRDYQGLNKVPGPGLPKVMVPTTAGTGSEVTFTAVFIRKDEKKKGGINSPFLFPEAAILDPSLSATLPPSATASTGLDALCHAIESFLSKKANFLSSPVSLAAIKLLWENLPAAYENGDDLSARGSMLYGSFLAGVGLANAGVTAVHSISYPLGGVFGVPHGIANGLLLPYVLEFEIEEISGKISEIYGYVNEGVSSSDDLYKSERFIEGIKGMLEKFDIPRLKDFNISPDVFPELAKDAMQIAVPIENNPVPISEKDIVGIYRKAY